MTATRARAAQAVPPSALAKAGIAVALTLVAGYVDAIGWLTLDRVFTAQMSGNLLLLAVHIVAHENGHVSLQVDAIAAFFLGLVVSGGVIEMGMRRRWRRVFVAALGVEFFLLFAFALAGNALLPAGQQSQENAHWPTYALIGVVAFAMGAQNTSLRMAGILSVWTTHMTGTLSGLSEELIVCLFSLSQPRNRRSARGGFAADNLQARHPAAGKNIGQSVALLAAFLVGAVAGAAGLRAAGVGPAMAAPLVVLVAVGLFDWFMPLTNFPSAVEQE